MQKKVIRILVVDDHQMVREALSEMLDRDADIEVVGQSGDGNSALMQFQELRPDVVLMDVALPDISGIEVTRRLTIENSGKARVLALSTHMDRHIVSGMLRAGALGYVSKTSGMDELLKGIRDVSNGEFYLSASIAAMLALGEPEKSGEGSGPPLGRRETEVLRLIAEGYTSAEIATQLHIATGTVDVHRRNIMRKLKLHHVTELTKYAIREGLIAP